MLVAAAQAHQIPNHCLIQYGHLFHCMNHLFLPAVPFSFVNEISSFFSFVVLSISFLYDDDVITAESPALLPYIRQSHITTQLISHIATNQTFKYMT